MAKEGCFYFKEEGKAWQRSSLIDTRSQVKVLELFARNVILSVVGIATSKVPLHRVLLHRRSLSSLKESCVVTVEPLSHQQVGLLGTQRGWPPDSTDTTITIITGTTTSTARTGISNRNNNNRHYIVNRSASLPVSWLFFLSNLPCRWAGQPLAPVPRLVHYYEQLLMADGLSPRLVSRTKTIEGQKWEAVGCYRSA